MDKAHAFLFLFFAITIAAPTVAATSPQKPASDLVTEVILKRVGGGPQWSGHGYPQDTIILRRDAKNASSALNDLGEWLQQSGFFSRKSGYISRPNPSDMGYLVIAVARGSQRKQVYSYNGARDTKLWQTEMVIRGVAQTIRLQAARSAWIKKHTQHSMTYEPD